MASFTSYKEAQSAWQSLVRQQGILEQEEAEDKEWLNQIESRKTARRQQFRALAPQIQTAYEAMSAFSKNPAVLP